MDKRFYCECDKCGDKLLIYCSNFNWKLVDVFEEKDGTKKHYYTMNEYTCDCGNEIRIEFDTWEYPIGIVDSYNSNVNGGSAESVCCYDLRGDNTKLLEA